jgi:hypothetical protein
MPGTAVGCPDADKDGLADNADTNSDGEIDDRCPGEPWDKPLPGDAPPAKSGCQTRYKLAWLQMEVLNNSLKVRSSISGEMLFGEAGDPSEPTQNANGVEYPALAEEPYLTFVITNGESELGEKATWIKRWCCAEGIDVASGQKIEPDSDFVGEENRNPQYLDTLLARGFTLFSEGDQFKKIDPITGLSMIVTLMERDWESIVCIQDQQEPLEDQILEKAKSIVSDCKNGIGLGCAFSIRESIIDTIESFFSAESQRMCLNVDNPDDYMGADGWVTTHKDAHFKTSKNGAYAFSFEMPTTFKWAIEPGCWIQGENYTGPCRSKATMSVRLNFCLYREGISENTVRNLCSSPEEILLPQL